MELDKPAAIVNRKRVANGSVDKPPPVKRKASLLPADKTSEVPSRKSVAGVVLVCGQGDVGQLGLGPDVMERMKPALVPDLENIVDICAGGMHSVCLNNKGEVFTFGCNDEGALGRVTICTDTDNEEMRPGKVNLPAEAVTISAGDSHSAALLKDGRVFIWGTFRDSHGTLGLSVNLEKSTDPIQILPEEVCVCIASGADHLAVITSTRKLYTCGCAEQGQLGRVSSRSADREGSRLGTAHLLIPTVVRFKLNSKIAVENVWAGTYCTFTSAKESGVISAFGLNNYGQLALKSKTQITAFFPEVAAGFKNPNAEQWKLISAGPHHTLALNEKGVCHALGRKEYGRLGLGKTEDDATTLTVIPALADMKCVSISCGATSSFAVTDTGKLYSWGMGSNGELGTGNEDDLDTPEEVTGKNLMTRNVIQVSGGGQHTMFLAIPKQETPVVEME